jgi:uncharacterized MnhB-related membrane protein
MTRVLSFLADLIIFLLGYCFLFVSVLILFFERNTDYSIYINTFYILLLIGYYGYFVLPLLFTGKTLGKKIFKISVSSNRGVKNIIMIHIKYLIIRLLPILSILLLFETPYLLVQILLGLIIIYPIFDYYYLKSNDTSFTDKMLSVEMKVY